MNTSERNISEYLYGKNACNTSPFCYNVSILNAAKARISRGKPAHMEGVPSWLKNPQKQL